jgi:tetratricopeptide (TPR) repeat protein
MLRAMKSRRRYTTSEVARLSELSERQVRSYVRAGVVSGGRQDPRPRGRGTGKRLRFDFREILVLKAARRLMSAGLPPMRVERALAALRSQLPLEQPLSALAVSVEGGRILVSDGDVRWEAETGQARLSFEAAGGTATALVKQPAPAPAALPTIVRSKKLQLNAMSAVGDGRSADGWFDVGLQLEENDPDGAYEAYLRALACDPEHVEAMINVGRLCSEAGDDSRAAAYFRQASRVDPRHPVAYFNLAVTLHDHGALDGALQAYSNALLHDPKFADAHFNLAALLEELGDQAGAAEHRAAYENVIKNQ